MAWMTIDQKREEIAKVYPADWWKMRVDAMPDHQVAAIYNRMLASGDIKPLEVRQIDPKKIETPPAMMGKTIGQIQEMNTVWKLNYVTEEDIAVGEQVKFKI